MERFNVSTARRLSDERGSALIISLMLLLIITILGLALFDLAQIENKSASASLADYRAFEAAQAGIERGIRELQNGFINDAYGSESWTDGTPSCTPGCNANTYSTLNIANTTIPAQTVTNFGTDPGGSYTVELKLLTVGEANNPISAGYTYPHGLTCFTASTKALVDPVPATDVCDNLAFLRSTGTVNGPPGYSRSRTIQVLVRASSTSPFAAGITVGGGDGLGNPVIVGQVNIAGSVNVLGNVNSNPAIRLVQGSQMWNNFSQMNDVTSLTAMRHRQRICPVGADCTGGANLVESLEADLRVYSFGNVINPLVTLLNGTSVGQAGVTACYGPGCPGSGRVGKGPLDGVYVGEGCPLPCTSTAFNLGGGSTLTVDGNNITKPYPVRFPGPPLARADIATPTFPDLTSPVTIAGTAYASYQANFWATHAQPCNLVTCPNTVAAVGITGLDDTIPTFSDSVSWTEANGALRNGLICWEQASTILSFVDVTAGGTCAAPVVTSMAHPMLINGNHQFIINPGTPSGGRVKYRGVAIWSTRQIRLDSGLTIVSDGTGAAYCSSDCFPDNHLLVLMSDFSIDIAMNGNVNRVMAFIFSNNNLVSSQRRVNMVGTLTAKINLCFNGASAGSCSVPGGGGPPQFFQANLYDPRNLPAALFAPSGLSGDRWRVTPVPRFWLECRVGPTDTLPTTPSGICSYQ